MNLAEFAIKKKTITFVLTFVLIIAGFNSFSKLGRLEDPEYTIKDALINTPYPGATAQEVEEEVTEVIARAVQKMGQLKRIDNSVSMRGLSIVDALMKDKYDKGDLPQVWDELRKKIDDCQHELPPGAGPSVVNDDYGDVYGVFVAVYGDEYSYAELLEFAKFLQRELLLVQDVKRIDFFGQRDENIFIEISSEKLGALGIAPNDLYEILQNQNMVSDSGHFKVGSEYIPISPTGEFQDVADIGNLVINKQDNDKLIYLKDVAKVKRGYTETPNNILLFNGQKSIGVSISTVVGGNVVTMGKAIEKRMAELKNQIPAGVNFGVISVQSTTVVESVNGFMKNLVAAIIIVIIILLFFMGLRSGLLIGFILLVTIVGSFIFMEMWGIVLQRISLGALIIALGMLVDNAIVVTEGMLVRIQRGEDRLKSAAEVCSQNKWPLLGATMIAVLAFAPIGLSQDSTGEYCGSLFQVLAISLLLSWLTAMTLTPLLCYLFLKKTPTKEGEVEVDPYDKPMFRVYRGMLGLCQRQRTITIIVLGGLMVAACYGFQFIDRSFFPDSSREQIMIDVWMPEGTDILSNAAKMEKMSADIKKIANVTDVAAVIGGGAPRFLLTYAPEKPNGAYSQFLISFNDYKNLQQLKLDLKEYLDKNVLDGMTSLKEFMLGPGDGGKIQIRISGSDPDFLRGLASQVIGIMKDDGGAVGVRYDWRSKIKVIEPNYEEVQARRTGITRPDLSDSMLLAYDGKQVGLYREIDLLIPIKMRLSDLERSNVASLSDAQVWSSVIDKYLPVRQIAPKFDTKFANSRIWRRNRIKTITCHADPATGVASVLLNRIWPKIDAIDLPDGYNIVRGGEFEDSGDAQDGLKSNIPVFALMMFLIIVFLFNSLKQPIIILITLPLALIGVTTGLLVCQQPFGFMALLGFLSLTGMLIKNSIVLLDQIEIDLRLGKPPFQAVMDSSVSRMRPVMMAASTTVLGMAPLVIDPFFGAMAVTIMFGLTFASILTLLVVPVLYAIFYKIKYDKQFV